MTATAPLSLAAAFVAGVAGSVHCLAMCGGLSGALGMRARKLGASPARTFLHNIAYQIGRVGSYTLAGAFCGSFGELLATLMDLSSLTKGLRVVAGLLLIAISLRVLVGRRLFSGLERLGATFWMRLSPLARPIQQNHLGGSLALGAQVWRLRAVRGLHTVAGALLLAFGVLTVLAPLQHAHH